MDRLALIEIKAGALNPGSMDCHVVLVYYYFFQNTLSSRLLYSLKKTKHASVFPLKKPHKTNKQNPHLGKMTQA